MGVDFLDPDLPKEINSARLVGGILIRIQPEERQHLHSCRGGVASVRV